MSTKSTIDTPRIVIPAPTEAGQPGIEIPRDYTGSFVECVRADFPFEIRFDDGAFVRWDHGMKRVIAPDFFTRLQFRSIAGTPADNTVDLVLGDKDFSDSRIRILRDVPIQIGTQKTYAARNAPILCETSPDRLGYAEFPGSSSLAENVWEGYFQIDVASGETKTEVLRTYFELTNLGTGGADGGDLEIWSEDADGNLVDLLRLCAFGEAAKIFSTQDLAVVNTNEADIDIIAAAYFDGRAFFFE